MQPTVSTEMQLSESWPIKVKMILSVSIHIAQVAPWASHKSDFSLTNPANRSH